MSVYCVHAVSDDQKDLNDNKSKTGVFTCLPLFFDLKPYFTIFTNQITQSGFLRF